MKLGRTFWQLWTITAASNLADGIGKTATPLLAAALTRDPLIVATLTGAYFLPWLLFALPSGAIVDRVNRSRAMALANGARAAIVAALGIAVVAGFVSVPLLYGIVFLLGCAETIADSASRAVLPAVVPKADLDRGNGYLQGAELVTDAFLGAPIASASFAVAAASPFLLGAGAFGLSAALASRLPPPPPDRGPDAATGLGAFRTEIADGVRWLARHEVLRGLVIMAGVMGLVGSGYSGIVVLYALEVLRVPEALFGVLIVSLAVGGLVGSLTATALATRVGRPNALRISILVGGVAFLGLGFVRDALLAGLLFAVSSWSVLIWNVLTMSLRQQLIPEALFGRVQGGWRTVVWGVMPLGAIFGGLVATQFGLTAPFVVAGVGHFVVVAGGWRLLARADAVSSRSVDPAAPDSDQGVATASGATNSPAEGRE
ncbi:MAG TPA: MFS transporter [Candidatus Limnocylindrales bacterium]